MAEPETQRTGASVEAFLRAIPDEGRRRDCRALAKMMREVIGAKPAMWGTSIVGFGHTRHRW